MKTNKIKAAICAIACQENDYIREWVEYYKHLGFSKIFLYDNNKSWEANEDFHDVIDDYIKSGFVELIDKRDVLHVSFQTICYNECYQKYSKDYDWIAFFDCDEYLDLKKTKDIHEFLTQPKFDNFHIIKINWESYDDNGHIYKTDGSLQERFPKPSDKTKEEIIWENRLLKSIVRGNLDIEKIHMGIHTPIPAYKDEYGNRSALIVEISDPNYMAEKLKKESEFNWDYKVCFADGEESLDICYPNCFSPDDPRYDDAVLKHYRTKSCQEYYENKSKRGFQDCSKSILNIGTYFYFNEYTHEKMQYFLSKNAEHPLFLIDDPFAENAGDFMFDYANALMATKDIKYPYDYYLKYNEYYKPLEIFKNSTIINGLNIFPQTILNDIKFSKNCTEYHYNVTINNMHKHAPMKIDMKLGRNTEIVGQFYNSYNFDKDYILSKLKDKNIEEEIKQLYPLNFVQTAAVYISDKTKKEDLIKFFEIYTNNVKYVIVCDNFEHAAKIVYEAMNEFSRKTNISISISWLYNISLKYSFELIKMYFVSLCRVNFIDFYNTTIWWGSYMNENNQADIIIPYNKDEIVSLILPIGDIRYKNLYDIKI